MAYNFKKLGEVEALTKVPEGANALIEVDGDVKRVPGDGLVGGIKTAIIKDSKYDNELAGVQTMAAAAAPETTYECINMTFEEAYETMAMGKPLSCMLMAVFDGDCNISGAALFTGVLFGEPCIAFLFTLLGTTIELYWTSEGFSTMPPGSK